MAETSKPQPDEIDNVIEKKIAVFLIKKAYNGYVNIAEKSGICLGTFDTEDAAKEFIKNNHTSGNKYFLCEGYTMG